MFAGVCGGIAETFGLQPAVVRVAAVLLGFLTPFPMPLLYLTAVFVMRTDASDGPEAPVDVAWLADGLRVAWRGPFLPHVVSWPLWIGGLAAIVAPAMLALTLVPRVATDLPTLAGAAWWAWWLAVPAGLVATLPFVAPRRYALTVTHDALLVDRPFRPTERVDLGELVGLRQGSSALNVELRSGQTLRMHTPPPNEVFFDLHEQLDRARRRALGHQHDLAAQEPERRKVASILSAGDPDDPDPTRG